MRDTALVGAGRGGHRSGFLLGIGSVVAASLAACGSGSAPAGSATPTATAMPTVTSSTTSSTTAPTATAPTSPLLPASLSPYMPLFPFAAPSDVAAWQAAYQAGGHQPWHLDSGQTALAFARWLGYPGIDRVVQTRAARVGVYVAVGHTPAAGEPSGTAAQVHVVRWGTGAGAAWEVVGTLDTTFSITSPRYGSTVGSPLTAGGLISGVDENIEIQVRSLGAVSAVGSFCCLPAGGTGSPWSWRVAFAAPSGVVLTVAVQTGGHLYSVERFAVTGVLVR
jgi:hypothetical protein